MLIRTATADDAGRLLEIYSYYVEKPIILKYKNIPSIFMRRDVFSNGASAN